MDNIEDALHQFGCKIGFENLQFSDEKHCALTVGGDLEILFERTQRSTELLVNGQVGYVYCPDKEIMRALLIANHNGRDTGPAVLSIDPVNSTVILGQLIDVRHLEIDGFIAIVEDFFSRLAHWMKLLPTCPPQLHVAGSGLIATG